MADFRDKVAVLTGAASGIGLELARQLQAAGARVWLADRNADALGAACRTLASLPTARSRVLDVTDRAAVFGLVDDVVASEGRIDFLFNNAGIGVGGEAFDFSADDWARVIDVNLKGVVHGVEAAYPQMVRQGSGHLINVASVAGLFPLPGEISYTASKFAVVGLSHALRAEAAAYGVRVSVVCPGKVETPIYDTSRIIGFDKQKALALWPTGVSPAHAARTILRGVRRNRTTIVITAHARLFAMLYRCSPSLTVRLATRYMAQMRRAKLPAGAGGN